MAVLDFEETDARWVFEQKESIELRPMDFPISAILNPLRRDIAQTKDKTTMRMNPLLIFHSPLLRRRPRVKERKGRLVSKTRPG